MKKVVGSKKALPDVGSAAKFHKRSKLGLGHSHSAIDAKHASVRARRKVSRRLSSPGVPTHCQGPILYRSEPYSRTTAPRQVMMHRRIHNPTGPNAGSQCVADAGLLA